MEQDKSSGIGQNQNTNMEIDTNNSPLLNDLPTEILFQIFSYLTRDELARLAATHSALDNLINNQLFDLLQKCNLDKLYINRHNRHLLHPMSVYLPDDKFIYATSIPGSCKINIFLLNVHSGKCIKSVSYPYGKVNKLEQLTDGRIICDIGYDNQKFLLDPKTLKLEQTFKVDCQKLSSKESCPGQIEIVEHPHPTYSHEKTPVNFLKVKFFDPETKKIRSTKIQDATHLQGVTKYGSTHYVFKTDHHIHMLNRENRQLHRYSNATMRIA